MVIKKRVCWGCGKNIKVISCYGGVDNKKMTYSKEAVEFGTGWVCDGCVKISKMDKEEFNNYINIQNRKV